MEFFIYECIVLFKPAGNTVSPHFEPTCFACAFSVTCINPWAGGSVLQVLELHWLCCLVWAENGAAARGAAWPAVCVQEGKEGILECRKVSLFETVPFGQNRSKEVETNWSLVAPGYFGSVAIHFCYQDLSVPENSDDANLLSDWCT